MQMLYTQTPDKQRQDPHARWVRAAPTALRCYCCDRDPALTLRLHSGQAGWAKLWRASSALGRFGALWASWSLGLAKAICATRESGRLAAWKLSQNNLRLWSTRPPAMKIKRNAGRNVPRLRRSRGPGHTHPGLAAWAKFWRAYGAGAYVISIHTC